MNINPMKLMQVKGAWDDFKKRHPKFPQFMTAVGKTAIEEGTVFEVTVTTAEGKTLSTNVKLTDRDMDLIRQLQNLAADGNPV